MAFDYINEAFKKLELLEEQMFDTSLNGINELSDFMDADNTDEIVRVIDPEADTDEDIQDSYVGKVIVNCNVCHSHIFENKDEIKIEDDGSVNIETQCPYCGEQEGFTIVGEIAPYTSSDVEEIAEETPVEENNDEPAEDITSEEQEEDKLEESLGLGLALGGAAIAGGMVGSKLLDSVEDKDNDETLTEKKDCEEALIDLDIDGSNSSVGFLGGTAATTNEEIDEENKPLRMSRASRRASITEDFKEVSITTEDQHMEMTSDENGKVTVTTEPVDTSATEAETIVPVSDETESEILNNNDVSEEPFSEDDILEDEETEMSFDDADEVGFDELGESYLKKVYENVSSFKTTDIMSNSTHLIVEGIIKFNSGVEKKTGFIFEAKDCNSRGQLRFVGTNKQLTESVDAFNLVGRIDNKKLFVESLKYNYKVNNESVRGLVRRK